MDKLNTESSRGGKQAVGSLNSLFLDEARDSEFIKRTKSLYADSEGVFRLGEKVWQEAFSRMQNH